MSSYLAKVNAAEAIKDKREERKKRDADTLMGSLSPYIQEVSLGEEGVKFANVDEANFNKLVFGTEEVNDLTAAYETLESYGDSKDFVKPKEHDLMVDTINSLSTARSYTDIYGNQTKEGDIVGVRINRNNGAIHYDLKTDQGLVPKTLGFSNDPKDIVMSSDLEGFRTLFNTATRKVNADSAAGALRRPITSLLGSLKEYDKNVLGEDGPVEYTNELDGKVARGEISPSEAFGEMSLINSAIQDEIDEFNLGAKTKTEAAATEFDRQAGTIDEAQAREIIKNGQFFDQSGNIQRQIVNLLPGNEIGLRTGVDKNTQNALRNSSGEQKLIQTQTTERTGGNVPRQRGQEKEVTNVTLTQPQPDTITQGGVEFQRTTPEPEVFKGTNLVFPVGENGKEPSTDQISQFLVDNEAELLRIGVEEDFLKDAQVLFNKYDIQTPEDFRKIPNTDPEIDFGRKEAALAYAMAAGGSSADVRANFEFAFNLMNTDDPGESVLDRVDRRTSLEQSRNTYVQSVNRLMSESMQNNRKAEADATEDLLNLGEEINYFKDFQGNDRKTVQDPTIGANLNKFQRLLQTVTLKGGVAGTPITFDPNTGLVEKGSISPGAATVLKQQIGEFVAAAAITRGDQQRGGAFGLGVIGGNQNLNLIAGDISTNMRIRTETVNGKEQIKEIVTLDPNGGQYVPVVTGNQFRSYFADAVSSGLVMSVIDRE